MKLRRSGRIGRRRATLYRDESGLLALRWRGRTWKLEDTIVRHRDDDGRIEFSLTSGDEVQRARYRRRGPRFWSELADFVNFTAEEGWTWEDRDFGLFVFHVASGTGPMKFRHRLRPTRPGVRDLGTRELAIDDDGVLRTVVGGRTEAVRFADVREIRVKFELWGLWAPPSILTIDAAGAMAVIPLGGRETVDLCHRELLPKLRRLPGWNAAAEAAVEDACAYALRDRIGAVPGEAEYDQSRAERPVWRRPNA